MANIAKIQKALFPHIPKIDPSIPFTKRSCIPLISNFCQYPCIPKNPLRASILCLKVVLILANSADPDEMQHDATFYQGLHC